MVGIGVARGPAPRSALAPPPHPYPENPSLPNKNNLGKQRSQ